MNNAKEVTLDDYIDDIRIVWNRLDAERSVYDTWLHTVNHAASCGEAVRRGHYRKLLDELADTVMWFLTFVGKLQHPPKERCIRIEEERLFYTPASLTDLVWRKYPYICPVCFFRLYQTVEEDELLGRKCDCLLHPREVETRNELLSLDEEEKLGEKERQSRRDRVEALNSYAIWNKSSQVSQVGNLQNMFEQIYQPNIESSSLESIAFHLLEEIGEVSDTLIRIYTYKNSSLSHSEEYPQRISNLESELADVVSWIFALCLKVKYRWEAYDELVTALFQRALAPRAPTISPGMNFWNILLRRYGCPDGKSLWCPICRNTICECKVVFATDPESQRDMGLMPSF